MNAVRVPGDVATVGSDAVSAVPSGSDAAVVLDEFHAVAAVPDPEIPTVTIEDLGILRAVEVVDGRVVVTITPTYSGCPAMDTIRTDIRRALPGRDVEVRTVLSPPWSTDQITDAGRAKLAASRIAPPGRGAVFMGMPALSRSGGHVEVSGRDVRPACPHCGSADTSELSRFGSTACKSLWRCHACGDPFDYFKAI